MATVREIRSEAWNVGDKVSQHDYRGYEFEVASIVPYNGDDWVQLKYFSNAYSDSEVYIAPKPVLEVMGFRKVKA